MLAANEKIENRLLNRIVVFSLIMVTFCCDWGVIGPFMAWLFYENRNDRKAQIKYYSLISVIQVVSAAYFLSKEGYHWYVELWQTGLIRLMMGVKWPFGYIKQTEFPKNIHMIMMNGCFV